MPEINRPQADLADARQVEAAEAQEYAAANGLIFLETSAKDATNVAELVQASTRTREREASTPFLLLCLWDDV